jgi:hypothetical protein
MRNACAEYDTLGETHPEQKTNERTEAEGATHMAIMTIF